MSNFSSLHFYQLQIRWPGIATSRCHNRIEGESPGRNTERPTIGQARGFSSPRRKSTMNEKYSTGPRTEEGKQRSSQNAIKHGIFARSVLLTGESRAEFESLVDRYKAEYRPKGVTEEDLVRLLAETEWRRRRIPALEAAALDKSMETGDSECKVLSTYSLYEQRRNRTYQTALKTLREIQAKRLAENAVEFRMAALLRNHLKSADIPWNPADDGFVFSTELLDRQLALVKKIQLANKTDLGKTEAREIEAFMAKHVA